MFDVLRILRLVHQYRQREFWPIERLLRVQERRLAELVGSLRQRSPFYADLPSNAGLRDLPIIDKSVLMEHWDDIVCDREIRLADVLRHLADPAQAGRPFRRNVVIRTSGTSGEPAVILYEPAAFRHVRALHLARGIRVDTTPLRLVRCLFGDRLRVACVLMDSAFAPAWSNFKHVPRATRLFLDFELVSLRQSLPTIIERLQRFRPQVLVGYPSILEALATEQMAGRMNIVAEERETWVVSVSEALEPWVREKLKTAFHARIQDLYGTGECLPLARSCPAENGLHVNLDVAAFEIVDERDQPVAPGQYGTKILVTNLLNRVLPVVRYAVPDIACLDMDPCPCGSSLPRIRSIRGRSDQHLHVRLPDGRIEILHPYFFMDALVRLPGLLDYQITQDDPDSFYLDAVMREGSGPDLGRIQEVLRDALPAHARRLRIEVRRVDRLATDPVSGKVKRFQSLIQVPEP